LDLYSDLFVLLSLGSARVGHWAMWLCTRGHKSVANDSWDQGRNLQARPCIWNRSVFSFSVFTDHGSQRQYHFQRRAVSMG